MKSNFLVVVCGIIVIGLAAWFFLATTYWLGCMSFERFDKAQTKMTFPGVCNVSMDGEEFHRVIW